MTDFVLRPIEPRDGDALAALLARSAGGGRYRISSRFRIDPWTALGALHGAFDGVVAERPGEPGLAGAGLVRWFDARFEGALRPHALLNTLVVDPAWRQRGLAGRLAAWRIAHARARIGADGVLFAGIQKGNAASVRTARRWCRQIIEGRLGVSPTPPARRAPAARSPFAVRRAEARDWEPIAAGLEATYGAHNFFPPEDASRLAAWHAATPFDTPWRQALVAIDARGNLCAGLSLAESARVRDSRMTGMPLPVRALNLALRLVPPDGLMREVAVSRFWFAPGHEAAARRVWDVARWEWRDRGSVFMVWADPRGPFERVLRRPPWMPHATGMLAIAGPVDADEERLVHPL